MNFRDEWVQCTVCDRQFVYTVEQQRSVHATGQTEEPVHVCRACGRGEEESAPERQMQLDPETGHWVGSVKWFDLDKGYGFIDRGDGTDVFFHRSGVVGHPSEFVDGQQVTYTIEETDRGLQAIEVRTFEG